MNVFLFKELSGGGAEPGEPELPVVRAYFIIPSDQDVVSITINSINDHPLKGQFTVYPTQEPIPTTNYPPPQTWTDPDQSIYSSANPYPIDPVRVISHGFLDGGTHLVSIEISPLRYIPIKSQVFFIDNITFTLNLGPSSDQAIVPSVRHIKDQRIYDQILDVLVDNPEDIPSYQQRPQTFNNYSFVTSDHFYPYVIITSPDLEPYMQEFVHWKRTRGVYTGVITTDWIYSHYSGDEISGIYDDAGKIRSYLYDAWYNHGTVWALLVGNESTIPIRYAHLVRNSTDWYDIIQTELYFSDLNSNWYDSNGYWGYDHSNFDVWPDIFVGRIIADSVEEFNNWFDKLHIYIDNPNSGDYTYLNKALLTQEDQMQWLFQNGGQAWIIANEHLPSNFNVFIMEEDGDECDDPTYPLGIDFVNKINENYGIISFHNHGSPISITTSTGEGYDDQGIYHCFTWAPWNSFRRYYYTNGAISGFNFLNETYAYSFIYTIACEVSSYDDDVFPNPDHAEWNGQTFSEVFLESFKKGAVAFAGNTRYGFINTSFYMEENFFDLIMNWGQYNDFPHTKVGVAEAVHKAMNHSYYILFSHNLFGDPEMDLWNNTPLQFTNVTHSDFAIGPLEYFVQTNVPYSIVSVSKPDESYYESVETDESGVAVFQLNFQTDDDFYIEVTKHNYIPYRDGHFPGPPSAPLHLSIREKNGHVLLRWDDSPEWDVQSYDIWRKTIPDPDCRFGNTCWRSIGSTTENNFYDQYFAIDPNGNVAYYKIRARDIDGNYSSFSNVATTEGFLSISKRTFTSVPNVFGISSVWPNPFNSSVSIHLQLALPSFINLFVYNIKGENVNVINYGLKSKGNYAITWNGFNKAGDALPSGIYYLIFELKEQKTGKSHHFIRKAILLK